MAGIYYHVGSPEKAAQLKKLAAALRLDCAEITYADGGRTVAALTGMPGVTAKTAALPPLWVMPELLLMRGLTDKALDEFLAAYRKAGIEPIRLKAVVTPFNMNWTVATLVSELKREADALN